MSDVPSWASMLPNRARSRSAAQMPPSYIPEPAESTAIVASFSTPSRDQRTCDMSSGIRSPEAASQTQPRTSVSPLRYSKGPPCGAFCFKVRRIVAHGAAGSSGCWRGAQPIACSRTRTSACGSR